MSQEVNHNPSLEDRLLFIEKELADQKAARTQIVSHIDLQREAIETPLDARYRNIVVRSFASEQERDFSEKVRDHTWGHIRPHSTLVAAMGNHWAKGSWQKVVEMMQYTHTQGVYCGLTELQDRCFNPYDALGTMRNEAILLAQNEGFEWLLYIDNDVLPEKDTLIKLLNWEMPIITPYVCEPGTGKKLFGPAWDCNQGLKPLKWSVLTMLLFRTSVFNCFPAGTFWDNPIGADEGFHYQKLWRYGHMPWLDTGIQLLVAGPPHYPLASNRLPSAKREALWDQINEKRNAPPDRSAIGDTSGKEFLPWNQPIVPAPNSSPGTNVEQPSVHSWGGA